MSAQEIAALKVKQDRMMHDLHYTCQWGPGERWGDDETDTGMSRLSLSDADKSARDWFVTTTESLGCKTTIDSMGNTFAVRPGLKDGPPTYAGSHLDTQPTGGRYDGILGVTAAVEMLRVLHDNDVQTTYPVGVVNWTNEEGARFPISMVASGVWAGEIAEAHAHGLQEVTGGTATMRSELERIGYLGAVKSSHETVPMAAHFELHIEQGPILEAEGRKVGVVQGVQAYKWFTIEVKGRDCHTGTTSFAHRADAMLAASKMIVYSHRVAKREGALASTGILRLWPGSTNTVPGKVRFSLDIRSPKDEVVEKVEAICREGFEKIVQGEDVDGINKDFHKSDKQCTVQWTTDSVSPAVLFHKDTIKCVEKATKDLFGAQAETMSKPLTSGAGHDSVYTSKRVPTSMIFIPCRDGVSHHPAEYSSPEDCAVGAQVLTGAVLHYDRFRGERGG
ncbi:Cell division control protein 31 [Sphaceloma murrayae]|uniref:Cell division control protein 31 n=1 Tax=Sphaceloma murrayae TaxID=2082308 RepID=A0A2K1QPY1_9PEZI|nr:Cell division control protein 31 [Sphaceloma murrayae]